MPKKKKTSEKPDSVDVSEETITTDSAKERAIISVMLANAVRAEMLSISRYLNCFVKRILERDPPTIEEVKKVLYSNKIGDENILDIFKRYSSVGTIDTFSPLKKSSE